MEEALVVLPVPTDAGGVTYAVARLVEEGEGRFADPIVAIPGTPALPGRRIRLSRHSLARIRPGTIGRPDLWLYEGMILPPGGA
jgi:hypothetical protein